MRYYCYFHQLIIIFLFSSCVSSLMPQTTEQKKQAQKRAANARLKLSKANCRCEELLLDLEGSEREVENLKSECAVLKETNRNLQASLDRANHIVEYRNKSLVEVKAK